MNDYPARINPPTTTHCTAPNCRTTPNGGTPALAEAEPRPVVEGTELCVVHHERFRMTLVRLVNLYPLLEQALTRKSQSDGAGKVQTSGITDLSQLWNPQASEALYELKAWIGFLLRTILTEHPAPETWIHEDENGRSFTYFQRGLTGDERPRLALAAIARHEARWLSSYPTLGAGLLQDALGHCSAAFRAIDAPMVRRVGITGYHCTHELEDSDVGPISCMGDIVAILHSEEHRPTIITCSSNPAHLRITKDQWMEVIANEA
jgi:hypothetical protein